MSASTAALAGRAWTRSLWEGAGRRGVSASAWRKTKRTLTSASPSPPPRPSSRPYSSSSASPPTPSFAFAFDIDGVLLRVADPIPGAADALRFLHVHNIPFILLTNGGGLPEAERVADLQKKLGLDAPNDRHAAASPWHPWPVLSTANFVQSHTPFQELVADGGGLWEGGRGAAAGLRHQTVLVTGSDAARARAIARGYGFRHVVTPADLVTAYPALWPFDPLLAADYAATAEPLPAPLLLGDGKRGPAASTDAAGGFLRIAAALVFNDPRDWALDIQLLTDLLRSRHGYLGTWRPPSSSSSSTTASSSSSTTASSSSTTASFSSSSPHIFFSNGDLLWATTYHLPRLGQGAFAEALMSVYARLEGSDGVAASAPSSPFTLLGKPNPATYRYAERVLMRYRDGMVAEHGPPAAPENSGKSTTPLRTVYMIGDNPDSDIAGANRFASAHGTDWVSVLVRTGVYDAATDGSGSSGNGDGAVSALKHRPRAVVDDVVGAVRWALQREGWPVDF